MGAVMFSRSIPAALLCLAWVGSPLVAQGMHTSRLVKRPVTVADVIEMTKLGDPNYFRRRLADRVAQFSPNGERFVVVLRKGNIARNSNEYMILLWETRDVFRGAAPDTLLTMSSPSNLPAIGALSWLSDNETITFIGEQPGDIRQIYTFNLRTRVLSQISHSSTNVLAYSVDRAGQVYAFTAEIPLQDMWNAKSIRDGVVITTQWLDMLVAGKQRSGWSNDAALFVQDDARSDSEVTRLAVVPDGWGEPFVSPDAKYVVIDLEVSAIPELWKDYTVPGLRDWTREQLEPGQRSWVRQFLLIDTKARTSHVLLNAPVMFQPQVTWALDSKSVVIAHTLLPLENAEGADREVRLSKL